jgi:hypothetical protein
MVSQPREPTEIVSARWWAYTTFGATGLMGKDRLGGVDVACLEIEFGCHRTQDRARALADRADGQPTTMVGVTPEIPRFVVHATQTNIC